jgi:hypothetical protein
LLYLLEYREIFLTNKKYSKNQSNEVE